MKRSAPRHRPSIASLLVGVLALVAIALPAATVAAQSTNPGTRIVEITGDPIDAPSQPDLVPATANGYAWRASGTGMSADFPENPTAAPFRVWAVGGQPVAFAPVALEQRDASGAVISSLTPTSASATIAGNTVRYAGLWANVDDVFTPGPTRVKHDTIVKVAPALLGQAAWYGTQWQVTLPAGMSFYPAVTEARVIADAGLMVVDEHGTACYSFGRVTLLDAANQTIDGQLRIEPAGDGYRLSIEAPASFMRTAAYPVTIDPTITILMNTDEANAWPWGGSNPQGCVCNRYDASQIGQAGTITAVAVRAAWTNYPALSYPRVVILMGETTKTAATFSATYAQNYDAAAQVTCYDGAVAFNAHNNGEWFENIVLTTPFSYSGSNALTVEMRLYGPNAQGLTVYVHKGQNPLNVRVYQANTTIGASGTKDQGNCNSIRLEMTDTPSITSPAAGPMPDGYVGTGYNVDVDASGGQAPLAFDISAGSLPPGLSIASGTGIISGNPTTPGNYSFTVRVTDNAAKTDTRAYTIAVYAAVTINSPAAGALAAGVQNIAYGPVNISASGGKPLLVYSIVSGSLPAGLSINSNSGAISGTPTATGTSNFTVRASDANAVFADRAYSITVVDLPTILSPSAGALTEGYVGDAYTQNFTAAGGQPAYSWSISAGALPAGLSINSGTGAISGSPSASGNFNFTVRVQDQNADFDTKAYSLQVLALPTITSPAPGALPAATRNAPNYTQAFSGTDGKAPLSWSATGLPAGMSINSGTGQLSGTPTAAGNFNVSVTLTDANGKTDVNAYTLTVNAAVAIVGTSLPDATEQVAYSQSATASGGTSPFTWSMVITPSLPELTMDPSTGLITGTPPTASSNNYSVQVTVTDTWGGTANKSLQLFVTLPTGGQAANCGCTSSASVRDSAFAGWLLLLLPVLLLVARRRLG